MVECELTYHLPYCSVETITLGDKRIGIRTSLLEEKATACNMLCCYADELKEGFFPWIDQVITISTPSPFSSAYVLMKEALQLSLDLYRLQLHLYLSSSSIFMKKLGRQQFQVVCDGTFMYLLFSMLLNIIHYMIFTAMPELLCSAKLAVEKGQAQGRDKSYLKQLSDYIVPALVEVMHKVSAACSKLITSP